MTVCVSFCPLVCLSVRWSLHGYPSASVRPCVFLSVRPYVRALVLTSVSLSFCLWFFRCTYVIYTYSHQRSPFIKFYSLSITYKTGFTLTSISAIPHFKEVVIMATNCDACGHRSNEVKSGGKQLVLSSFLLLQLRFLICFSVCGSPDPSSLLLRLMRACGARRLTLPRQRRQ